jgi:hypothetical protein
VQSRRARHVNGDRHLTQNGTNDVTVTISLVSPLEIVNTGLQQTIDFNLLNTPTITATNSPTRSFR